MKSHFKFWIVHRREDGIYRLDCVEDSNLENMIKLEGYGFIKAVKPLYDQDDFETTLVECELGNAIIDRNLPRMEFYLLRYIMRTWIAYNTDDMDVVYDKVLESIPYFRKFMDEDKNNGFYIRRVCEQAWRDAMHIKGKHIPF